ncbi:MAG: S-layer homology domain-containing protein [Clostridia bacterium]|nr:S-layer homology domain-containing protein [Clostridia bacterium]
MKKLLTVIILLASLLTVTAYAGIVPLEKSDDGTFYVASFNGTKNFLENGRKPVLVEDACYYLAEDCKEYNIKYVSFMGRFANLSTYNYSNTVAQGMTKDDLYSLCENDEAWKKQFKQLAGFAEIFKDEGIPYGFTLSYQDHFSDGFYRSTFASDAMPVEKLSSDMVSYTALNDENYYTIVENNGASYVVAQLETFPRAEVINWFNTEMSAHPDKRIIVFTHSLIDNNGNMYTMWDWDNGMNLAGYNTVVRGINIANIGNPHDGDQLWNKCLAKHDNLLAVITAHTTVPTIVTTKLTTQNGYDVAVASANPTAGNFDLGYGPLTILTEISPDNKEITFCYYSAGKGYLDDSVKTVKLDNICELGEPVKVYKFPKIQTVYNGENSAYILGYEGNTFRPNANMTRAEACTIFARLLLKTQAIPDGYVTRFEDVKTGDWFYNAIAYLDQSDFFYRNESTTYKPNEPITRAEFVDLAVKASSLAAKNSISEFADVTSEHFYYDSIIEAANAGIVNGYEDNTFRPDNTITRAEVVTVINRLLGLKVSEKTVSTTNGYNVFSDSKSHWALYNIIMASNSNVHGDSYFTASLDGVTETSSTIDIANSHIKLSISKKNGKLLEAINLANGESVLGATQTEFAYITLADSSKIPPSKCSIDGNQIKFTFRNGEAVYMLVDVEDDFISFEINSELSPKSYSVGFANINTVLDPLDENNDYRFGGMGMTAYTYYNAYGLNVTKTSLGVAYSNFDAGTMGAKVGVVLSHKDSYLDKLKKVADAIDRSVGLASDKAGPYTFDAPENTSDYVIVSSVQHDLIDSYIEVKDLYGFEQIDVAKGMNSFIQGDFSFPVVESGKVEDYYKEIGSRLDEAGVDTGLHTYGYYIDYASTEILSNPKWQKQLEVMDDVYTLRKDISRTRSNLPTVEDATNFDNTYSFFYKNSRYVLIDEEIIHVGQGTTEGFINVKRGQCGTEIARHYEGAKIYHLSGYFNHFCPVIGSELFYHVADRIAEAYNKGGFDMIYFDAMDGLGRHVPSSEIWYYFQMFLQRTLSQCKTDPIVEDSAMTGPQIWNVRARVGAWDTPHRSYKNFFKNHIESNLRSIASGYTPTLGWIHFYPDVASPTRMKNVIEKTLFHDDIDYFGVASVVYNMSNVISNFSPSNIENSPHLRHNLEYYNKYYSTIRRSNYFTEEAKQKVIDLGGEFKIIEKKPGEYAFLQMYYSEANLGNAKGNFNSFTGNNPFSAQNPFVRIEARYSTEFNNPISLFKLDSTKTLSEQKLSQSIKVDMSNNMALSFPVKGTGKDGDAMLISLSSGIASGETGGHIDYFIDLNFDGWRDVVLLDADNAEYDINKYKFDGITTTGAAYPTYRVTVYFTNIENVTIRTTGTGDQACVGEIMAYEHINAPVKNPTVTVGSSSVTFNTTLNSGEYIEYDPLTGEAYIFDNDRIPKKLDSVTGTLNVGAGRFTATYTGEAQTSAPTRAKLVFGFSGQEITN